MLSKIKIVLLGLVTLGIVVISIYMPEYISSKRDADIVGNIKIKEAVKMDSINQETTLIDRLQLFGAFQDAIINIPIESGEKLQNQEAVREHLKTEIVNMELEEWGISILEDIEDSFVYGNFCYSIENPSRNSVYWEVDLEEGSIWIDDVSGKIIRMQLYEMDSRHYDSEAWIAKWESYLGLKVYDIYDNSSTAYSAKSGVGDEEKAMVPQEYIVLFEVEEGEYIDYRFYTGYELLVDFFVSYG